MPSSAIKDLRLCTPCHDQHKVVQDWRETEYAVPGEKYKDCSGCHMPEVARAATAGLPTRKGKSHRFPASHDLPTLQKAASLTTSLSGRTLAVEVRNDGTGHNFPADERHRAVDLVLFAELNDGTLTSVRLDRYRNPYRDEFDLKNPLRTPGAERDYSVTFQSGGSAAVHVKRIPASFRPNRTVYFAENMQIPSGEARAYTVSLPENIRKVTVRLYYKNQPFLADAEARLLHEATHVVAP